MSKRRDKTAQGPRARAGRGPSRDSPPAATRDLHELADLARELAATIGPDLAAAVALLRRCLDSGGRVLACGNGGSAADASHLVAELVGRYRRPRPGLPAVCLSADGPTLTALVNDFGVEQLFARQVQALGRPGDALVVFSTSGRSPNILAALAAARAQGLATLAFLGAERLPAHELADVRLRVPSRETPRIQELHAALIHALVAGVEAG